ncbi:hypothetical protein SB767_29615, partial [Bacillus sp. SIMBA_069]
MQVQSTTDVLCGAVAVSSPAMRLMPLGMLVVVAAMPAVKEGRLAAIVGESLVMATSAPSVLSIPWSLDRYVPVLA